MKINFNYALGIILLLAVFTLSCQEEEAISPLPESDLGVSEMIIEDGPLGELPMTYYCGGFTHNNIGYTVLSDFNDPSQIRYITAEDGTTYTAFGFFDINTRYANVTASTSSGMVVYSGSLHF